MSAMDWWTLAGGCVVACGFSVGLNYISYRMLARYQAAGYERLIAEQRASHERMQAGPSWPCKEGSHD